MLMSEAIGYLHFSVPGRRFIFVCLFVCFYRPDGNQLSKTIGVHFG